MAVIESLVALLGFELKGEGDLKRFQQGLDAGREKLQAFAAVAVAAAGIAGAALTKSVIGTGATFESLEATLETIEGSSSKAKAALAWVQEFAAKTPYDLQQVSESFVRFRAYGLDPMDGSLESVGNAASAMGKDLMAGVEAVADAAQGEFERLKEFGIRAEQAKGQVTLSWQEAGKTMKKTVKKDGAEISKAIRDIFDRRFSGAMARQAKTWKGLVSNLGDGWTGFLRMISDAGVFEYAKGRISNLLDYLGRLKENGTLGQWAKRISDAMIAAGQSMERFGRAIKRLYESGALKYILIALGALVAWIAPFIVGFLAAGLALDDFLSYMEGGESIIGAFIEALPGLIRGLDSIIPGFGTAATEAMAAFQNGDWSGMGGAIARAIVAGMRALVGLVADLFGATKDEAGNVNWADLSLKIMTAIVSGLWAYVQLWTGFWSEISGMIISTFADVGSKMASAILAGLQTKAGEIIAWFSSLIPDWAKGMFDGGGLPQSSNIRNRPGVSGHATPPTGVFGAPDPAVAAGKLSSLAPNNNVNQDVTITNNVNVAGTSASGQEIANKTAAATQGSLKNAYFTSLTPATA